MLTLNYLTRLRDGSRFNSLYFKFEQKIIYHKKKKTVGSEISYSIQAALEISLSSFALHYV
jgi:hypothetical protein